MHRDDAGPGDLRAVANKVIRAFNSGDCDYVREVGNRICQTHFPDRNGYREDLDLLVGLEHVFGGCKLFEEQRHMADVINNLPPPYVLPPGDTHFLKFAENGRYQVAQRQTALKYIRNLSVALDIGAHVGFWANGLARYFEQVHSFEPDPENFKCLIKNKFANVTAHNCGVGDVRREGFLSNPSYDSEHSVNSGGWEVDDVRSAGSHTIEFRRIDDFRLKPAFIKIDVQGYEENVLRGAYETIMEYRPVILIEMFVHGRFNHEARDYLENTLGMVLKERVLKDFIYGWNL